MTERELLSHTVEMAQWRAEFMNLWCENAGQIGGMILNKDKPAAQTAAWIIFAAHKKKHANQKP